MSNYSVEILLFLNLCVCVCVCVCDFVSVSCVVACVVAFVIVCIQCLNYKFVNIYNFFFNSFFTDPCSVNVILLLTCTCVLSCVVSHVSMQCYHKANAKSFH